jgi:DNA helicase II / ATP-dependent DNA helicase PcrA
MPQAINVSDEDISYAEKIILPDGKVFDEERRAFIRNLNTIDLQAVPGSGKTTALLAKLLILERKLPFTDGSGILVISHTNAAIDEIKEKIYKHCPKLFSYPNYVGTIQGFVDQFLAIPFFISKFKKKPNRIDNQIYDEAVKRRLPLNLKGFAIQDQKNARYFLMANKYEYSYRLAYRNNAVCLVKSVNGDELDICRPRSKGNGKDFTEDEKAQIKEWLIKFKISIMLSDCVMHFDDAYFLAELYINKIAPVKMLLQKRFSFVFVDEMQDMDAHQYNLLENIFYDYGHALSKYQRIGDKNQAIFSSVKASDIWTDRAEVLKLSGSQRLSMPIANVVKKFALHADSSFDIVGLNESNVKPHILVFDDETIKKIIPTFIEILKKNNLFNPDLSVKVICWNTDWKDDEVSRQDPKKLRLENYFDGYRKEQSVQRQDYDCLKSYLLYFDKKERTLKPVRQNILNALLKSLRLEKIYDSSNRPYTLNKLLDFVRDCDAQKYEELNLNLYNWSIELIKGNVDTVWEEIKTYVY